MYEIDNPRRVDFNIQWGAGLWVSKEIDKRITHCIHVRLINRLENEIADPLYNRFQEVIRSLDYRKAK
jgi:hypothetical protein